MKITVTTDYNIGDKVDFNGQECTVCECLVHGSHDCIGVEYIIVNKVGKIFYALDGELSNAADKIIVKGKTKRGK